MGKVCMSWQRAACTEEAITVEADSAVLIVWISCQYVVWGTRDHYNYMDHGLQHAIFTCIIFWYNINFRTRMRIHGKVRLARETR